MTETTAVTTTEVDADPLFTADETADYLRVHLNTTLKLLRANAIPATKVGRQWRVRRSDLNAFMCKQRPRVEVLGSVHSDPSKNHFVIVGPTGSGKSEAAAELRKRHPDAWIEEVQLGAPEAGKSCLADHVQPLSCEVVAENIGLLPKFRIGTTN